MLARFSRTPVKKGRMLQPVIATALLRTSGPSPYPHSSATSRGHTFLGLPSFSFHCAGAMASYLKQILESTPPGLVKFQQRIRNAGQKVLFHILFWRD